MASDAPADPPDGRDVHRAIGRGGHGAVGETILAGSGLLLVGRLARTLISVLGMMTLARLLSPADFGVMAWATAATLLSLVLLEGLIDYPAIRDDDLSRESLSALIWSGIALTGVFGLILWFGAPLVERLIAFPHLGFAVRAMIPVCLSQVFFVAGLSILRRQHRFAAAAGMSVVTVALYMLVAVVLVVLGHGIHGVIIALVIANTLTAAMLAWLAQLPLLPPRDRRTISRQFHVSGYGALSRMLAWGWANVDTLAASIALGPSATGIYSRAYNINVQAKEPFLAIDQTMRQVFASSKASGGAVGEQMRTALTLITLASGVLGAALIVLRDQLVFVLLGAQWTAAALPLAILSAGLPARVARLFFDGLSVVLGDMPGLTLRHAIILAAMGAALLFAAPYGIAAVALAATLPLYLALLFPLGAKERAAIGSPLIILRAMLPGLGLGAALVALNELVIRPALAGQFWLSGCVGGAAVTLAALAVLALLPDTMIGSTATALRRRITTMVTRDPR